MPEKTGGRPGKQSKSPPAPRYFNRLAGCPQQSKLTTSYKVQHPRRRAMPKNFTQARHPEFFDPEFFDIEQALILNFFTKPSDREFLRVHHPTV